MALTADGKIVVAGGDSGEGSGDVTDFAVAQLIASGALDPTFGTGGKVTLALDRGEGCHGVVIQSDGKVVLVGAGAASEALVADFVVCRLNLYGTLGTSFDADGWQAVDFSRTSDAARGVALDTLGRIVVAGAGGISFEPSAAEFAVTRLNPDVSLDTSFGDGG